MRRIPLADFKEISKDYRAELNGGLTAAQIGKTDRRDLIWQCSKCGDTWKAKASNRIKGQQPCPKCSSLLKYECSLAHESPQVAKLWRAGLNGGLTASQVRANNFTDKYIWSCEVSKHEYEGTIGDKVRSYNRFGALACPICLNRRLVEGVNDLFSQRGVLATEWDGRKNDPITPKDVTIGDTRKVWWVCGLGHEYQMKVGLRAQEGQGCTICAGKVVLAGFNDFASRRPEAALEWDFKGNTFSPDEVALWSGKMAKWKCEREHRWEARISKRAAGHGCHTCSNRVVKTGFNDLKHLYPLLAEEFDEEKNAIGPGQVLANDSTNKYWWKCSEGHEWQQFPMVRQKSGCGDCAPLGFKANRAAKLYFIENPTLGARKVGITNIETKEVRLAKFAATGWSPILTIEYSSGNEILVLERRILRWIREDLGLPQFLGPQEMSQTGGWTETFSGHGPTNHEIARKINEVWWEMLEATNRLSS